MVTGEGRLKAAKNEASIDQLGARALSVGQLGSLSPRPLITLTAQREVARRRGIRVRPTNLVRVLSKNESRRPCENSTTHARTHVFEAEPRVIARRISATHRADADPCV